MIFTKDRLLNALERIRKFSTGTYTYDANGNTTYDPANQISTVYNYLNLPSKFTKDNGATQEVVYDVTGKKWQVNEFFGNGDTLSRKSYIGSFEFERNSLQRAFHPTGFIQNLGAEINSSGHTNGNLEGGKIISTQKLKSGVKSEYIADQSIILLPGFESDPVFHAEIKSKSGYQWNYILRDHLGNTRVVFADKNKDGLIRQDRSEALNEVLSFSNYSPFGLELGGSHQNLKQQFEYKLNGKQENGFTGLTDFGGRYLDKYLGVWAQVDPKSERFFNQSTRNFTFNNPIRLIDPDGRAPFDWVKLQNGRVKYDVSVTNQAQAIVKYGAGSYIGKSAMLMNASGQQLNLNANGTATSSTMLNEVTVSAKAGTGGSAIETAMKVNDAVGLSNDMHATVLNVAKALDKVGDAAGGFETVTNVVGKIGTVTGAIGFLNSTSEAIQNPTVGNLTKSLIDGALLFVAPEIGVINGILDATGVKDKGYKYLDKIGDNFQSNRVINSQTVDTSKIRIK